MYFIVVLGTAGSGKSYMTAALADWMEDNELSVARVNLDPAAEWIPYTPDVDVRNYVDARDLMAKMGLGPNGALVAAVDMMVSHLESLVNEIRETEANYVILDTPGQMELFAFRSTGPVVLSSIIGGARSAGVFLVDPLFASRPSSLLSVLLLYTSVRVRVNMPLVPVLSKADIVSASAIQEIRRMLEEPPYFEDRLYQEGVEPGIVEVARSLTEAYAAGESMVELVEASAKTMAGIDAVYAALQQVLVGGEDYLTEEPSPRI